MKKGDVVVIAISGGKDSIALAYVLSKLSRKYDFKVIGLHIDLGIEDFSKKALEVVEEFRKITNMKIFIISVKDVLGLGIPDLARLSKRPTCSICGLVKRYLMNAFTVELNASAIATGHNMDDITANIIKEFLNQNISSMIKLVPSIEGVDAIASKKIRPLYEVTERENLAYVLVRKLPFLKYTCPFIDVTGMDKFLKRYLVDLDIKYPGLRKSFIRKFVKNSKVVENLIKAERVSKCKYCGLISSGDVCAFCRITERILGRPGGPLVREFIRKYIINVGKSINE